MTVTLPQGVVAPTLVTPDLSKLRTVILEREHTLLGEAHQGTAALADASITFAEGERLWAFASQAPTAEDLRNVYVQGTMGLCPEGHDLFDTATTDGRAHQTAYVALCVRAELDLLY